MQCLSLQAFQTKSSALATVDSTWHRVVQTVTMATLRQLKLLVKQQTLQNPTLQPHPNMARGNKEDDGEHFDESDTNK